MVIPQSSTPGPGPSVGAVGGFRILAVSLRPPNRFPPRPRREPSRFHCSAGAGSVFSSGVATDRPGLALLGHLLLTLPPTFDGRRLFGHLRALFGLLHDPVDLFGRQAAHLHERFRLDDRQIIV